MAIDFPDSPTFNQQFTVGDRIWTWDGNRWEAIAQPTGVIPSQSVSSNITLSPQTKYFVNTSAARTLTLPASPDLGDEVFIYDASALAETNNITVLRNGNKINALEDDAIIDVNQSVSIFTYTGSTIGWRFE